MTRQIIPESTYQKLSDSELYSVCKKYGFQTLNARRKFAGTLPEVYRRRLYRRRGYVSIYEFAAKLAGMNQASVDRILRLSKKVEDKPALREQLETGAQGWSKIEKVACIATPETDKKWAGKVETLSAKALGFYVGEVKRRENVDVGILKNKGETMQVLVEGGAEKWEKLSFNVSPKTKQMLKLFKQEKKCLTFDETLRKLLEEVQEEKPKVEVNVCPECAERKAKKLTGSRHIPVDVRRVIYAKYEGVCAFPGCCEPATNLHHTKRFTLKPNHEHVVPLCDGHEGLLHAGLIENEEDSPEEWRLCEQPDIENPKFHIDRAVVHYRREGRN